MSVEKFRIGKKVGNFTTIPNKVIQGLSFNLPALGLYVYLSSLPEGWEFHKSHLRDKCQIGINRLNKILKFLESCKLLTIAQNRDAQGKFAHFDMDVHDGMSFKINDIEEICAPSHQSRDTVTVTPLSAPINKIYKKEISKKEISKSYYASDDARNSFENFWFLYPRKKDKLRAQKIWIKNKLYEKSETINSDLAKRKATEWRDKDIEFIPHPSTYLNGERWNDEINISNPKKGNSHENSNQSRSQSHNQRIFEHTVKMHLAATRGTNKTQEPSGKLDYNPLSPI